MAKLRLAAVQHDIVWEDPAANFDQLEGLIVEAAVDADLVVLTEMFATGFSMAASQLAEGPEGPTASFLQARSTELGVAIAGSRPALESGYTRPVNQFVLHVPGGPVNPVNRYAKAHPFSFAGEDDFYDAGSQSVTFDLGGVRITPFVCYDLRFADQFWARAEETDLFLGVANWPAARRNHWLSLLPARAIENQAYVVGVNRVGSGDGIAYCGDSRILDPLGEVLAEGGDEQVVLRATVDTDRVGDVRSKFPFLADRKSVV